MTTNILLVEDNPKDQRLVQIALAEATELDYAMDVANTLAEAVAKAKDADVILLDINLPDSMGLDTLTSMIAAAPHAAVIVLTGLEDGSLGEQSIRAGAQDFLVKGRMFGELLSRAVRYAKERHNILLELKAARGQ